jgi:hypothetical protein
MAESKTTPSGMLVNGVKAVGEVAIVPGLSLLVDGDVKGGVLHAAAAVVAGAILGPFAAIGWLVVGADSYSKSLTGQHFHELFKKNAKA